MVHSFYCCFPIRFWLKMDHCQNHIEYARMQISYDFKYFLRIKINFPFPFSTDRIETSIFSLRILEKNETLSLWRAICDWTFTRILFVKGLWRVKFWLDENLMIKANDDLSSLFYGLIIINFWIIRYSMLKIIKVTEKDQDKMVECT